MVINAMVPLDAMWQDFGDSDRACILRVSDWIIADSNHEHQVARALLTSALVADVYRGNESDRNDPNRNVRSAVEGILRAEVTKGTNYKDLADLALSHLKLSDLYRTAESGEIKSEEEYWSAYSEAIQNARGGASRWQLWLAARSAIYSENALLYSARKQGWMIKVTSLDRLKHYMTPIPKKGHSNECASLLPIWLKARVEALGYARVSGNNKDVIEFASFVIANKDTATTQTLEYALEERGYANFSMGKYALAMDDYQRAAQIDPKDLDLLGKIELCRRFSSQPEGQTSVTRNY